MARLAPADCSDDVPLALIASEVRGQIVTAVNGGAYREGIRAGMALADARAILPGLATRMAEPGHDRTLLRRLTRWAGRYGPGRNCDGDDGLWVDITGVAHLFVPRSSRPHPAPRPSYEDAAGETALLRDIVGRLGAAGLTARAGLADTLGAAHALARFASLGEGGKGARTAVAPPGETRAALAMLPVDALRLEPATLTLLKRLGLRRIGDLYGLPRAALERRFRDASIATRVLARLDQALGISAEPRRPLVEAPAFSVRRSFAEPLIVSEAIEAEVKAMTAGLVRHLTAAGQGVRRILLSLYRTDASVAVIAAGTSRASRDPVHLLGLLAVKLAGVDAGFGIDVLTLDAMRVERLDAIQAGLDATAGAGALTTAGRTSVLIDRLANRLGPGKVLRLEPRASHVPERSAAAIPALYADEPRPPASPLVSRAPRPPFLLSKPEPISVVAEIPEGAPARFVWRRLARRIVKAEGPERIEPEWWRPLRGVEMTPMTASVRDYYRLEDEGGGGYWVFRLGLYRDEDAAAMPGWYMHGLFP